MNTRIAAHGLLLPALLTGLFFTSVGQAQTNESALTKAGTNSPPAAAALLPSPVPEPDAAPAAAGGAETQETKPHLSPWANELAKMAQAGIGNRVMLAYIDSVGTFNLGPDQIVYLRNLGVSNEAINAALEHDGEIASGQRQVGATTVPSSGTTFPKSFLASAPSETTPPAKAAATSTIATPVPNAWDEDTIVTELPDSDDSSIATVLPDRWPGLFTWLAQSAGPPAHNQKQYPVREPYPVRLTQPVIMLNAAGRTPNLFVIEGLP